MKRTDLVSRLLGLFQGGVGGYSRFSLILTYFSVKVREKGGGEGQAFGVLDPLTSLQVPPSLRVHVLCWINPLIAHACKISGLKGARTRLQTMSVPCPIKKKICFQFCAF